MNKINLQFIRKISTTCINFGKRNFREFDLVNKRGMRVHKEQRAKNPYDEYLMVNKRGLKISGYTDKWGRYHEIPERIPELIVPNLDDFYLKPYVSYRTSDIKQEEFTAETLFNVVYATKIIDDFDNNKLNADGSPKEPSEIELMTPEKAKQEASKTGTDLFTNGDKRPSWLYNTN